MSDNIKLPPTDQFKDKNGDNYFIYGGVARGLLGDDMTTGKDADEIPTTIPQKINTKKQWGITDKTLSDNPWGSREKTATVDPAFGGSSLSKKEKEDMYKLHIPDFTDNTQNNFGVTIEYINGLPDTNQNTKANTLAVTDKMLNPGDINTDATTDEFNGITPKLDGYYTIAMDNSIKISESVYLNEVYDNEAEPFNDDFYNFVYRKIKFLEPTNIEKGKDGKTITTTNINVGSFFKNHIEREMGNFDGFEQNYSLSVLKALYVITEVLNLMYSDGIRQKEALEEFKTKMLPYIEKHSNKKKQDDNEGSSDSNILKLIKPQEGYVDNLKIHNAAYAVSNLDEETLNELIKIFNNITVKGAGGFTYKNDDINVKVDGREKTSTIYNTYISRIQEEVKKLKEKIKHKSFDEYPELNNLVSIFNNIEEFQNKVFGDFRDEEEESALKDCLHMLEKANNEEDIDKKIDYIERVLIGIELYEKDLKKIAEFSTNPPEEGDYGLKQASSERDIEDEPLNKYRGLSSNSRIEYVRKSIDTVRHILNNLKENIYSRSNIQTLVTILSKDNNLNSSDREYEEDYRSFPYDDTTITKEKKEYVLYTVNNIILEDKISPREIKGIVKNIQRKFDMGQLTLDERDGHVDPKYYSKIKEKAFEFDGLKTRNITEALYGRVIEIKGVGGLDSYESILKFLEDVVKMRDYNISSKTHKFTGNGITNKDIEDATVQKKILEIKLVNRVIGEADKTNYILYNVILSNGVNLKRLNNWSLRTKSYNQFSHGIRGFKFDYNPTKEDLIAKGYEWVSRTKNTSSDNNTSTNPKDYKVKYQDMSSLLEEESHKSISEKDPSVSTQLSEKDYNQIKYYTLIYGLYKQNILGNGEIGKYGMKINDIPENKIYLLLKSKVGKQNIDQLESLVIDLIADVHDNSKLKLSSLYSSFVKKYDSGIPEIMKTGDDDRLKKFIFYILYVIKIAKIGKEELTPNKIQDVDVDELIKRATSPISHEEPKKSNKKDSKFSVEETYNNIKKLKSDLDDINKDLNNYNKYPLKTKDRQSKVGERTAKEEELKEIISNLSDGDKENINKFIQDKRLKIAKDREILINVDKKKKRIKRIEDLILNYTSTLNDTNDENEKNELKNIIDSLKKELESSDLKITDNESDAYDKLKDSDVKIPASFDGNERIKFRKLTFELSNLLKNIYSKPQNTNLNSWVNRAKELYTNLFVDKIYRVPEKDFKRAIGAVETFDNKYSGLDLVKLNGEDESTENIENRKEKSKVGGVEKKIGDTSTNNIETPEEKEYREKEEVTESKIDNYVVTSLDEYSKGSSMDYDKFEKVYKFLKNNIEYYTQQGYSKIVSKLDNCVIKINRVHNLSKITDKTITELEEIRDYVKDADNNTDFEAYKVLMNDVLKKAEGGIIKDYKSYFKNNPTINTLKTEIESAGKIV